jgi:hypothetical protein
MEQLQIDREVTPRLPDRAALRLVLGDDHLAGRLPLDQLGHPDDLAEDLLLVVAVRLEQERGPRARRKLER